MRTLIANFSITLTALTVAALMVMLFTLMALPTASPAALGLEVKIRELLKDRIGRLYQWIC